MDIRMTGVNPSSPLKADPSANLEKEQRKIDAKQKKDVRAEQKQQELKEEKKEKVAVESGTFVMSSLDMKELLLMMGSRGPSKQIETLVKQVKKERDDLKLK